MKSLATRGWRSVFARADVYADAPLGLDDTRALVLLGVFVVPFVPYILFSYVVVSFVRDNHFWTIFWNATGLVAAVVTFVGGFAWSHRRAENRFRAVRASIEKPALAAGWTYRAEMPLPSPQTREAVFYHVERMLISHTFTEVTIGRFREFPFSSGHIIGHELSAEPVKSESPTKSENVIVLKLPGLLPEFKLFDRTTSRSRDYGVRLPVVPSGDTAVDARWEIQTHYPDFVADLLSPQVREYLANVPRVPCTINSRNGYLIASRDPQATFDSVIQRLEILSGFIEAMPPVVWQRETTPYVAGVGMHGWKNAPRVSGPAIWRR